MKQRSVKHAARPAVVALAAWLVAIGAPGAWADVVITEEVEGREFFRIATDTATYLYDKEGAALAHVLDRDGGDWVGFRPVGTPGIEHGKFGWFRGIPNLGSSEFGHTGWQTATSTTPDPQGVPLPRAAVTSSYGDWHLTWAFSRTTRG
jgi:hypothetical protein